MRELGKCCEQTGPNELSSQRNAPVPKMLSATIHLLITIYCSILSKYIEDRLEGGQMDGKHENHTGKCIRRFGGLYAYCQYFIDRKW